MPGPGSCSACAVLLLAAVVPPAADASHLRAKKIVHQVDKVCVTAELRVRDGGSGGPTCGTNYSLCPESLSGGCCPDGYGCATDSCFATTAATTGSACGRTGYFACGIDSGGKS